RPLATGILNDQHLASVEFGLLKTKKAGINYSLNMFSEGDDYLGIRHNVNTDYIDNGSQAMYSGSYLTSKDLLSNQNTEFYRHKSLLLQKIEVLRFAYTEVFENNKFLDRTSDALAPRSYQFWEWEESVSNADSSKTSVKVFYRERRDRLNYSDELKD